MATVTHHCTITITPMELYTHSFTLRACCHSTPFYPPCTVCVFLRCAFPAAGSGPYVTQDQSPVYIIYRHAPAMASCGWLIRGHSNRRVCTSTIDYILFLEHDATGTLSTTAHSPIYTHNSVISLNYTWLLLPFYTHQFSMHCVCLTALCLSRGWQWSLSHTRLITCLHRSPACPSHGILWLVKSGILLLLPTHIFKALSPLKSSVL
jgi:hypothetical protein